MSEGKSTGRGGFATQLGFIFAAAGSAVGLGNIWKFPYITGEYGGGAFVLVYLGCILLVGLPLMYAELIIGRRGGKDVLGALLSLTGARGQGARDLSLFAGGMAVAAGFLILSFYSVVAGWAIHFFWVSLDIIKMHEDGASATFTAVAGNPLLSSVWHTLFMLMTVAVVARGVHGGIERLCSRLMPALVGILVILLVYVGFTGGLGESLKFLFKPDFSKLSGDAVLEALGHAFFTLSLGMGAMVTYGSYLGTERNVVRDGLWVAFLDTVIALMAGAVIFAVVFSAGGEPAAGPGLVFMTLPDLFVDMPFGMLVAAAFFLLLVFAAWSSAVSLLEVVVAWLVDERGIARSRAAWGAGALIWLVGLSAARWGVVIDFLDDLTTRYMLPVGGLCIAIAAGWLLSREDREAGFKGLRAEPWLAPLWTVLIRFVTPALVLFVIIAKMGLLEPEAAPTGSEDAAAVAELPEDQWEAVSERSEELFSKAEVMMTDLQGSPDILELVLATFAEAAASASQLPEGRRPDWVEAMPGITAKAHAIAAASAAQPGAGPPAEERPPIEEPSAESP
jgi:NSS family neurotransmitter:Na+ symporter